VIVIVRNQFGDENILEDVAAVVCHPNKVVTLCRDGQADEIVDREVSVVVVP
jgi:hypothetical protein